jgi:hypothetical protein
MLDRSKEEKLIDQRMKKIAKEIRRELEKAKNKLNLDDNKKGIEFIDSILKDLNTSIDNFNRLEDIERRAKLINDFL